jgi:hypothetical protein
LITITTQGFLTFVAVVTGAITIITLLVKFVHWFDRQKAQDDEMKKIREQHDADVAKLRSEESKHTSAIKEEQQLLTYGILACLKGLQEKGCNGPVTEAISVFEKHLNKRAHE